jgi:hypothetical protein
MGGEFVARVRGGQERRKNLLFVNKKKQKNFIHLLRGVRWARMLDGEAARHGGEFFGSFFQKRTFFLPGPAPHRR